MRDGKKKVGGNRGLSYTWTRLEEAAKRAVYCCDRSVGYFSDQPELSAQKTCHQKLPWASQGSSVMIVFGLWVGRQSCLLRLCHHANLARSCSIDDSAGVVSQSHSAHREIKHGFQRWSWFWLICRCRWIINPDCCPSVSFGWYPCSLAHLSLLRWTQENNAAWEWITCPCWCGSPHLQSWPS